MLNQNLAIFSEEICKIYHFYEIAIWQFHLNPNDISNWQLSYEDIEIKRLRRGLQSECILLFTELARLLNSTDMCNVHCTMYMCMQCLHRVCEILTRNITSHIYQISSFLCWHYFAYVAPLVFLRDVWIRTQRAAIARRCATNLATHLPFPSLIFAISANCVNWRCTRIGCWSAPVWWARNVPNVYREAANRPG